MKARKWQSRERSDPSFNGEEVGEKIAVIKQTKSTAKRELGICSGKHRMVIPVSLLTQGYQGIS